MSVLLSKDCQYLLDHRSFTQLTYKKTRCQGSNNDIQNFVYHADYFEVQSPHIQTHVKNSERRGKKRKIPMNEEETTAEEYHSTITSRLKTTVEKFSKDMPVPNNSSSKKRCTESDVQCKSCSKSFQDFCRLQTSQKNNHVNLSIESPIHLSLPDTVEKLVMYSGQHPRMMCISRQKYLLPPKCSFLQSDVTQMDVLLSASKTNGGYNIIVTDPPWENKSAKRGKKYPWLTLDDILKIPLKQMMSSNCIVFVWVTNRQKIHRFVKERLFPTHGVEFAAEWHWIKVTKDGVPIFDFSSAHKRTYETVIVGKTNACHLHIPPAVMLSVPCTIHSHKPPLSEVIGKTLSLNLENSKCLELFARNLTPGWTSWGNEVLELQSLKHFEYEQ